MNEPIGELEIIDNDKTYKVSISHPVGYLGCNCVKCKLGRGIISFDFYKGMLMQEYLELFDSEKTEKQIGEFKKEFISPYFSEDEIDSFIMG